MSWEFIFPNLIAGNAPQTANIPTEAPAEMLMDSDAFAVFYQRSARSLWAYLARVSADPSLADDLTQESFVRFLCSAARELPLAEGEVGARRYLFRIATNLLRDHWRHPAATSIEDLPAERFAHSGAATQSDTEAVLGAALAQLRPRDRQILWLAYAEGYSHREIAQITGLASTGIRILLFRARRKIATLLAVQGTAARGGFRNLHNVEPNAPAESAAQGSRP
jgi:RNA polymerase sigma-70 factor (ECF subfamily)